MATTSRGRLAGLASTVVRLHQQQTSKLSRFESVVQDHSKRTDDAGEAVLSDLKDLPVTMLHASDFADGTVRLRYSGKYVLAEDVEFDPPATPGDAYPKPPYQLGFFAAVTIEAPNVVLDLGGHTLRQSERHALRQRFFSIVELSDQPFLQGQGPSDFGSDEPGPVRKCVVQNGILGRSAHHGVHGNEPIDVVLRNLVVTDFEVAAIHLSNPTRCTLQNVHVHKTRRPVPVRATYSQAVFARDALRSALAASDEDRTWRGRTGAEILADVEREIDRTEVEILTGQPVSNALFRNDRGELDGNCYGIVIHKKGVAIGPMAQTHKPGTSVFMVDVCVEDISSTPAGVCVYTDVPSEENVTVYGAGGTVVRGPVGDVMDLSTLGAPNMYTPTVLSEVQFYLGQHHDRGYTPTSVLAWAQGGTYPELYKIPGLDSMAHTMKGTAGVFLSGIDLAVIDRLRVQGVRNKGNTGHRGDVAVGVLGTACARVTIRDSHITGSKTCGSEFLHGSNVLLERTVIADVPVPVMHDASTTVTSKECGHATLVRN